VTAAKLLLEKDELQEGFLKLISMRRPNLTVEWAVLDPHWSHIFHQKHLDAARRRLDQAAVRNYRVPAKTDAADRSGRRWDAEHGERRLGCPDGCSQVAFPAVGRQRT